MRLAHLNFGSLRTLSARFKLVFKGLAFFKVLEAEALDHTVMCENFGGSVRRGDGAEALFGSAEVSTKPTADPHASRYRLTRFSVRPQRPRRKFTVALLQIVEPVTGDHWRPSLESPP